MARGDALEAGLAARFAASAYTLTVNYPAARPAATGTAPGAAPASPLTGPAPTATVYPAAITPIKPAVSMPCLFMDLQTSVVTDTRRDSVTQDLAGWWREAHALARVRVSDAATDPDDLAAGTVFDDCLNVLVLGQTYRVLGVRPVAAGFRTPTTFYVWLVGNIKQ